MSKKNLPFTAARLVKATNWYIEYYQTNPSTKNLERFREKHNLNRIKDLFEREATARKIVKDINQKLRSGYPFAVEQDVALEKPISNLVVKETLLAALERAKKIKTSDTDRYDTKKTYRTAYNNFEAFLKWIGWEGYK